jgi:hypothetical protein
MTSRPPRSIWLLSENRRSMLAVIASVALVLPAQRLLIRGYAPLERLAETDLVAASLLLVVMVWAFYAFVHTTLTWLAFGGLHGDDFVRAINADPTWLRYDERRRSGWYRWLVGVGPMSWSSGVAMFALIAVVALVLRPALREVPVALGIALSMVAVSWVSVGLTYALHYARVDHRRPGLEFPGEKPDSLVDYLYLALGVQATFGTTDVDVRTRELRAQVLSQSVLAFVFNTVIIGMVISLLLGLT